MIKARAAIAAELRISVPCNEQRCGQVAQAEALTAVRVEVGRIQPRAERAVERGPFLVDAGVPRRVTIAALVDARLPEDAFVRESQALRGRAGRGVQRV